MVRTRVDSGDDGGEDYSKGGGSVFFDTLTNGQFVILEIAF